MVFKTIKFVYSCRHIILLVSSLSVFSTVAFKYGNKFIKKREQKQRESAINNAIELHTLESKYLEETSKIVALDEKAAALEVLLKNIGQSK